MIKKIRALFTSLVITGAAFAPALAVPAVVHAQNQIESGLCAGVNFDATDTTCDPADEGQGAGERVNNILETVINLFSLVVGIVSVFMIIVGGFKYITSGGDSASVGGAKNTILFAIVGLVIVALAQFIVQFVLAKATEA